MAKAYSGGKNIVGKRPNSRNVVGKNSTWSGHKGTTHMGTQGGIEEAIRDGVSPQIAKSAVPIIGNWSGSYYRPVREAQIAKNEGKNFNQTHFEHGEVLEKFIAQAPKWNGGEVARGVHGQYAKDMYQHFKANQGSRWSEGTTSSYSSREGVAKSFAGPTGLIYHLKATQTPHATTIRHISGIGTEHEVLMSKHSEFTIGKTWKDKSGLHHVELYH